MQRSEFRLGPWRIQPELNSISDGTQTRKLEPKAMDLLVLLAGRPGELFKTDDIIDAVWSGAPVADNPLYKTVTKLRQALGDDSRNPKYIATVSKRGYLLVASAFDAASAPDTALADKGSHRSQWVFPAILFLTLGAALVFVSTRMVSDEPLQSLGTRANAIGGLPGNSDSPRHSPVADSILFVNDSSGTEQVWLHSPDKGSRRLSSCEGNASSPAWHPNGQSFIYGCRGDIFRSEFATDSEPINFIKNGLNAVWSPDGSLIAFERGTSVWLSDSDGGMQRQVAEIASRNMLFRPRQPQFSPDGMRVLYFEDDEGPLGDFWELTLSNGDLRRLTNDTTLASDATYTPDGKHIVFSSQRGGSRTLWSLPARGGPASALLQSSGDDFAPDLSRDGKSLVFVTKRDRWSLVSTNPNTGVVKTFTESSSPILAPVVSPDKSAVAYFSVNARGDVHIYVFNFDDASATRLTNGTSAINTMPTWSGDGQFVYFYSYEPASGNASYSRVSLKDGHKESVAAGWQFNRQHDAAPSPDGESIVVASAEQFQILDTLIRDVATGSETSLGRRLSWFDWSKDNERFVATDFSRSRLPVGSLVLCTRTGECDELAPRGQHPIWSGDEQSVYYVDPISSSSIDVWKVSLTDGLRQKAVTLAPIDSGLGPFIDAIGNDEIVWVKHQKTNSAIWRLELR